MLWVQNPHSPPQEERGGVQGSLHTATETRMGSGLDLVAHLAMVPSH